MVPLVTAMSIYRLPIVTMSMQRFGRNFVCKVAACSHYPHAPNYGIVFILALIVAFDITASPHVTCMGLYSR